MTEATQTDSTRTRIGDVWDQACQLLPLSSALTLAAKGMKAHCDHSEPREEDLDGLLALSEQVREGVGNIREGAKLAYGPSRCGPAAPSPDAALIALCAEHAAHFAAVNSCDGEIESDPQWPAYTAAFDAISAATPQTFAGLIAMAKSARIEAKCADDETPEAMPVDLAWQVINGLLRLHGAA